MPAPEKLTAKEHGNATAPAHPVGWADLQNIPFRGNPDRPLCFKPSATGTGHDTQASYYVGGDWLIRSALCVQVSPKLPETDHAGMLFACLRHPSVAPHIAGLYTLDLDAPLIPVERQDDLLTPLLVTHFLQLLQAIVRKGLKKGYVPVAKELRARVKGKVDVARTIRQGVFKQRLLSTACQYDEFSTDIAENQFLKRVLRFVQRFIATYPAYHGLLAPTLAYCVPAFEPVQEEVNALVLRQSGRQNPLFAEYAEALRVGQLLLARFGYSLDSIVPESADNNTVLVPPHWVDMSRLFELHTLGLLKDKFGETAVLYGKDEVKGYGGVIPDFLIRTKDGLRIIADAKYKPLYQERNSYDVADIRQVSGYARDREILTKRLKYSEEDVEKVLPPCLILYPAKDFALAGNTIRLADDLMAEPLREYTQFFKSPVPLAAKVSQL